MRFEDEDIRKLAAFSLVSIGREEATRLLYAALRSEKPGIRAAGVYGLGLIGDPEAIRAVAALSGDTDAVKLEVARAMAVKAEAVDISL